MRFSLAVFLFVLLMPAGVRAHPHEWVDVRSVPVFKDGSVTAIKQYWRFDPYYTALSLPAFDADKNKALDSGELMALARENLANLKDFNYFTYPGSGAKKLEFSGVTGIASRLEGGRIALDFTLTLAQPADMRRASFRYRIYDPSYYVAMLHGKADAVTLENAPAGCKHGLAAPSPDAAWTRLAQSLDKNAAAPDDLGKYFAELVTITCP